MTKKLTGREAVIALMQGKSVKRKDRVLGYVEDEDAFVYFDSPFKTETFESIAAHDDWQIVPEPMVWEGEEIVTSSIDDVSLLELELPISFYSKRVKVRIEEIL